MKYRHWINQPVAIVTACCFLLSALGPAFAASPLSQSTTTKTTTTQRRQRRKQHRRLLDPQLSRFRPLLLLPRIPWTVDGLASIRRQSQEPTSSSISRKFRTGRIKRPLNYTQQWRTRRRAESGNWVRLKPRRTPRYRRRNGSCPIRRSRSRRRTFPLSTRQDSGSYNGNQQHGASWGHRARPCVGRTGQESYHA